MFNLVLTFLLVLFIIIIIIIFVLKMTRYGTTNVFGLLLFLEANHNLTPLDLYIEIESPGFRQ